MATKRGFTVPTEKTLSDGTRRLLLDTAAPAPLVWVKFEAGDANVGWAPVAPLNVGERGRMLGLREQFEMSVIGQTEAVNCMLHAAERFLYCVRERTHPVYAGLLLGPTGVGKTYVVQTLARVMGCASLVRVDCAEFQYGHEVAKLIGSPPGYLGHKETSPRLSDASVRATMSADGFGVLLFDEIEKAHPDVWQLMLGALDSATLRMGTNDITKLDTCAIFFTSNLGAAELGLGAGFAEGTAGPQVTRERALRAVDRHFSPEFLNRLDEVVYCSSLDAEDIRAVLRLEMSAMWRRQYRSTTPLTCLVVSEEAQEWLLARGFSSELGAREMKRTIMRHVALPLSRIMADESMNRTERVKIDVDGKGELVFYSMARTARAAAGGGNK
ncbi:MAG: ATP-dependent Clp protease ATP-binding subunit [Patescibacteria group bacterium]|nr:ATP-dependent Clp protease ATP-binding subunit [Patescibacteria group bacterium]